MLRIWRTLLLSIYSVIHFFPATGQEYSYMDFTVKDGLAGSTVYSMAKDKDGFLWFGTETGLSRYDGSHFRNFYMSDGLPDNEIIKLMVDSRNRVWIIPFKNSLCYYQNGKIHNQQNDSLLRRLKVQSEVVAVLEDKQGDLIIAETKGIHIVHPSGKIDLIDTFDGVPLQVVQAGNNARGGGRFVLFVERLREGEMWADLDNGKLEPAGIVPFPGPNNSLSSYIAPDLQTYMHADSLFLSFPIQKKVAGLRIPNGFINFSRVNDSSLMLNAYTCTYLYNLHQLKIVDSFLPGQMINGVMGDPDGGTWFSSLGGGLHRLANRDVLRYTFREGNTVFPVFSIRRVGSTLCIGTERYYLWMKGEEDREFRRLKINSWYARGRITVLADLDGKKMIAGTDAGAVEVRVPEGTSRVLWFRGSVKALSRRSDTSMLDFSGVNVRTMRIRDGALLDTVWAGRTTSGLTRGDSCYVGTLTGLYVLPLNRQEKPRELLEGRVSVVAPAANGGLWAATYGEGIFLLRNGRVIRGFTTAEGLTSNTCRCLYVTGGSVWIGTDKGLNKLTAVDSGYTIAKFTAAEGLGSDIINTVYVEGQKVYAGTAEGMVVFREDQAFRNTECRLRMTGISAMGRVWPLDTANFTLPYNNRDLQVEYVGISYQERGLIQYRYRLLGSDDRWGTTEQGFLHYPSLPPGHYELQILAVNPSGAISSALRLPFSIGKPWWENNWVRLLFVLALAGFVWVVFHRRVTNIRRKEEEKTAMAAKVAELEQMALRSRMNPHFIFNSLNSIQLFVMEKDIRGANEFITQFSRLIRQTLDISARTWLSLEEEIEYLSTYLELERKRFEDAFGYDIFVEEGIDKRLQMVPPMILQPYVENAVLHGIAHRKDRRGWIGVSVRTEGETLVCTIEDNGVGRERSAQFRSPRPYPSRGMELTAKRISILNGALKTPISAVIEDLAEEGGNGGGTRVVVRFPL